MNNEIWYKRRWYECDEIVISDVERCDTIDVMWYVCNLRGKMRRRDESIWRLQPSHATSWMHERTYGDLFIGARKI